jgi:hypothetical protein
MENMSMLPTLIQQGDWMVKTDIKDAYLCIPVHQDHQTLLGFWWGKKSYQFQVCPFGLGSAPRVFTKLLKPAIAFLRKLGVRILIYLDDCLILNQDKDRLLKDRDTALWILQALGFVINWKKSMLIPNQQTEFLGFEVDSVQMTLKLPKDKIKDIVTRCQEMVREDQTTVRKLAKLIGKLTAASQAVLPAPLFYRRLQMQKTKGLCNGGQSYESIVGLTTDCKKELRWWIQELSNSNGKAIIAPMPDMVITTDASKVGWGGIVKGTRTQGQWSEEESKLHINILEMKAAEFVVKAFTKDLRNIHCHLRLDNKSCVAQINKMGGTRSESLFEALEGLWHYCLDHGITITAEHLPGVLNNEADEQSRIFADVSNWKLREEYFRQINLQWGPVEIDLFADRLNAQVNQYVSWKPDPAAVQVDAFEMNWRNLKGYMFPPFCLIGRCLGKVRKEQATLVLVAPVWTTQVWYPQLLSMLVEQPILFPPHPLLLTSPRGEPHPLVQEGNLTLAAWKVSGDHKKNKHFQQQLKTSLEMLEDQELEKLMGVPGRSGWAGACHDKLIPFKHLWNLS